MALTLQQWNDQFGIPGVLTFEQRGDLICAQIELPSTAATVFVQGAQVTHLTSAQTGPILFLGQRNFYAAGKPLRGGIPVSFPWFGADTQNRAGGKPGPSHGFARIQDWTLVSANLKEPIDPNSQYETLHMVWTLGPSDLSRSFGYDHFLLTYEMAFHSNFHLKTTGTAELTLTVTNTGTSELSFEEALHTYLAVDDVTAASVWGLQSVPYLDKTDGSTLKQSPAGPLVFTAETDSVFPANRSGLKLTFPRFDSTRDLVLGKVGSNSTIVWNPWSTGAAKLPDLDPGEWSAFVCLEAGNVGADRIVLAPGASHVLACGFLPGTPGTVAE